MSRSIHTTYSKSIFGLTKAQIEEQFNDPNSDLASLAKKSSIKRNVIEPFDFDLFYHDVERREFFYELIF